MITSPVLFIIFNRPETTKVVFEAIREAQPTHLFIAADGPRQEKAGEYEKCQAARDIAINVDWECEVQTLFRDTNLGCKAAVSSAIDWYFDNVEEGIILEDDCLPEQSFFAFCEELLNKYRNDHRIGLICGDNFQFGRSRREASYYFSRFTHIWGWATWRRAWKCYDVKISQWPDVRDNGFLNDILDCQAEIVYWTDIFEKTYAGQINTWDYQLMFSYWVNGFINVIPNNNLVKNIGFNAHGTHVTSADSPFANMETRPMQFPLKHPLFFIRDTVSDLFASHTAFGITVPAGFAKQVELESSQLSYFHEDITSVGNNSEIRNLIAKAMGLYDQQKYNLALDYVISAKAKKVPHRGLDLLRAQCFLKLDQKEGAMEALREELRWFPDNAAAKSLLDLLALDSKSQPVNFSYEAEFLNLLDIIRPFTMLSEQRLYSLYRLARHICENNIPGNFVECGVAAGGSSALLAYVIKHYSRLPRRLYAFDSFSGMPEPTEKDTAHGIGAEITGWGTGTCAAPEESVQEACAKVGAAELLTTVKGYFEDTLPGTRNMVGMIALLHLDGDWYESTAAILRNLYDHVTDNGIMQADDYGHWEGCKKAIHEFEAARGISFSINAIDGTGVWFAKPDRRQPNPLIPSDIVDDFLLDDPCSHGVECQMSPNERFQLYYIVRQMLKHKKHQLTRFIEIGSHAGGSLQLIASAFKKENAVFQGIAIEPRSSAELLKVLEQLKGDVLHMAVPSHAVTEQLSRICSEERRPLFVFVDGDHRYEAVCRDIRNYYPLLAPGGIIAFHDWLPPLDDDNRQSILLQHAGAEPGVRDACRELMEELYGCVPLELPVLYPDDPTQTQSHLPIIPGITSTLRVYRKPNAETLEAAFNHETVNILTKSGALSRMHNKNVQLRPLSLFCETVNICNSECVMCPYTCQTRTKGTMSDELFMEIIRQYAEMRGGYLSLTPMVGDILLDKHIPQRLKLLQEVRDIITPSITSNLFALGSWDDDTVVQMLQTFQMLHVSCYGISPEEHRAITRRDQFDCFLTQMRRLIKLKKESNASAEIAIGFRALYQHAPETVQEFQLREFGQVVKTSGVCSVYCNWGNSMSGPLPGEAYFQPAGFNTSPCLFLTMAMMVFWNGAVSACACCDFNGDSDLALGELGKDGTLMGLFNGERNHRIWQQHQNSALPRYCERCSFHKPLDSLHDRHPLLVDIYSFIGG
jgi:predicted O-methyltransferase YrrM